MDVLMDAMAKDDADAAAEATLAAALNQITAPVLPMVPEEEEVAAPLTAEPKDAPLPDRGMHLKKKYSACSKEKIIASVAPERTEDEVEGIRFNVMEATRDKKAEEFVTPEIVTLRYVCSVCGNNDQSAFIYNKHDGDVVCMGSDGGGCGNVVEAHHRHEGSQYRKFEGEEDKSHHGPAPNKLYSAAHNMRTTLVATGGAGGATASRLRQAYEQVELNLSNLGSDERRTRVGYKDMQKKRAFDLIVHAQMNLSLHPSVVNRAQELFATFRDHKEYVLKFNGVVAACLIQAAEEAVEEEARAAEAEIIANNLPKAAEPAPLIVSKRAQLLSQPLAFSKRTKLDPSSVSSTKKPGSRNRAGKDWAAHLGDLGDIV